MINSFFVCAGNHTDFHWVFMRFQEFLNFYLYGVVTRVSLQTDRGWRFVECTTKKHFVSHSHIQAHSIQVFFVHVHLYCSSVVSVRLRSFAHSLIRSLGQHFTGVSSIKCTHCTCTETPQFDWIEPLMISIVYLLMGEHSLLPSQFHLESRDYLSVCFGFYSTPDNWHIIGNFRM